MDSPVGTTGYGARHIKSEQLLGRTRGLLIFVIILAAVTYALSLKSNFTYFDEADYYFIASNLLHHNLFSRDGVQPTAYRPPGYPASLVPVLALYNSVRFA